MSTFLLADILAVTRGTLLRGTKQSRATGVSIDTRSLKAGDLFVAIKGERFDGHDFLNQAVANGARMIMISDRSVAVPLGAVVIRVRDTLKAYGDIARFHRRRFSDVFIVAITGTAGKTTTKEFVSSVLRTRYCVLSTEGTKNNHIGVPATLLKLRRHHRVAVIEMGTNYPGEIDRLAEIVEPSCAVFTNIGSAHLAGLGSSEGVFREKSALAARIPPGGALVINVDDSFLARLLESNGEKNIVTYAVDNNANLKGFDIKYGRAGIVFQVGREMFMLKDCVPGNVYNALAAIACGRLLKVPDEDIRRGLRRFRPPPGRQCFYRVGSVVLIDDAYNANPLSFRNAVKTLELARLSGKIVLVVADMLELGDAAFDLHLEAGVFAAERGVDLIVACGVLGRKIGDGALGRKLLTQVEFCEDKNEIQSVLRKKIVKGDVVLVKGSRGMKMEGIVSDFLTFLKGKD